MHNNSTNSAKAPKNQNNPVKGDPAGGYPSEGGFHAGSPLLVNSKYQGPKMADYGGNREAYFSAYQAFWASQIDPPDTNRGGINLDGQIDHSSKGQIIENDGTENVVLMPRGKKGKTEVIRVPSKNSGAKEKAAHVDQLTFVIYIGELLKRWIYAPYSEEAGFAYQKAFNKDYIGNLADIVPRLSSTLYRILGIPITTPRPYGMFRYTYSWELGDKDGFVAYGGNNDTLCVHLTGQACLKAAEGWEKRLHEFLSVHQAKITRIDLAADLFDRQYSPEQARADYHAGLFTLRAQKPFAECRGGGWENEDDKSGLTFYVGRRANGKLLRVYEKGLHVMGKLLARAIESLPSHVEYEKWVRVECEFRSVDRILPHDMLTEPGKYLAGAYPALSWLNEDQEKVRTFKKTAQITIDKVVDNTRRLVGKTLWALRELYSADELFEKLTAGRQTPPRWLTEFGLVDISDEIAESWEREMSKVPF